MDDLFELRLTHEKGFGLFAIKDITQGTRIICEAPIVHVPHQDGPINVWDLLIALPPDKHASFCDLSYSTDTVSDQRRAEWRQTLAKQYQYSGTALDLKMVDVVKMHAIFYTNAVDLEPGGDRSGTGLFLQLSRINHSCCPNVGNCYNTALRKQTVHALRDIQAGEELLTTYIDVLDSKEGRNKLLFEGWGFECSCQVCEAQGLEARASELRRRRMFEIKQGIAVFTEGLHQYMNLPIRAPQSAQEALDWSEELIGLLREEGLSTTMDVARAYRNCSEFSLLQEMHYKALAYAKKEQQIERICIGDDSDHLKEKEQGAKWWIEHIQSKMDPVKRRMNEKREAKEKKRADNKAAKKPKEG